MLEPTIIGFIFVVGLAYVFYGFCSMRLWQCSCVYALCFCLLSHNVCIISDYPKVNKYLDINYIGI